MKFSTKEDIEAPIEDAFALFTDFDQFERSALRRGGDVQRTDKLRQNGAGMSWAAQFKLRGKMRKIAAEMTEFTAPENYCLEMQGNDIVAFATLDLMPLSKSRTRASMAIELKPKSLSGRLMVQTLRLGKTRLDNRFKAKAADFVRVLEREYKSRTAGV
ncbi:SRPBCC family protein [Planktotalea arctica]|uniref:SRPBCC family protein n=1 Tax=Planktotalea arctica TaxID=1481893 RepID=UPI000A173C70|nr:SRPBCC family protein [Planktotalea arctica]